MPELTRRSFLTALSCLPFCGGLKPAPAARETLAFHPNAFSLVWPLPARMQTRMDVLYGYGVMRPRRDIRTPDA